MSEQRKAECFDHLIDYLVTNHTSEFIADILRGSGVMEDEALRLGLAIETAELIGGII